MDGVCEDMKAVGVITEDARDRVGWRKAICCGDPNWDRPKKKERRMKNKLTYEKKKQWIQMQLITNTNNEKLKLAYHRFKDNKRKVVVAQRTSSFMENFSLSKFYP